MSAEENGKMLSDLHAAINNRDLDRAMSLFAEDATLIVMPGGTCYTTEQIRKYIEKLLTNFPKYVFRDIQPPVVSGDMATHEYMVDVGLKDGRKGSVPSVIVAEFRNHRITQMRVYLDKLEAAKQLAKGLVAKRAVASVAKQVEALVNP